MSIVTGPPASAIRNQPITQELRDLLDAAALAVGVDAIFVVSGGQPAIGEGTRRTGSTRHDHGRAADIKLFVGGVVQTFTDASGGPVVADFVTAAAARGAIGIGAGVTYMGNDTIHVGFGTSVSDHTKLTWGAGGRSANAPQWLRRAAQAGWAAAPAGHPVAPVVGGVRAMGRYEVIARGGLNLRGGPGTGFPSTRTLPQGTTLHVVAVDPTQPAWVRVDLEGDGLLDGYVFSAYLAPIAAPGGSEAAEEPGDDGIG
ncbi:SH3 domain-containing protein [Mycobacterium sp. KBS0706]|uniref:SH3 domain-containing protein n=1 Tax=Mycobacterium sp. KBS0706 TaxID=2578109 RepID=UPI00163DDD77|nr:SH3 domain-containing protein [Mycobacterium sp. KBS0706]